MNTSITARDFYNLVLDATRDSDAADSQAMFAYASDAIAKLDARNEKRRENAKPSKAAVEASERRNSVLELFQKLGSDFLLDRDQIAESLGITPGQATSAATYWVKEGKIVKAEGKKAYYRLA